jgi:ABC-type bacteriocin/lantibiotic exporter with double-glycine peptidase domain
MINSIQKGRVRDRTGTRPFFSPALAVSLVVLFSACSSHDFAALRPGIEMRGHYIESVPFYRQTESTCGPAALAAVLSFQGHPVTLQSIADKVYLPQLRGTLPMDLENYAREAGFTVKSSAGTLDTLRDTIRKGIPVICLLDLGFSLYRKPHYVTALGFDEEKAVVIVHDGREPNRVMEYNRFTQAWDRAGRWMLVIQPGNDGNGL